MKIAIFHNYMDNIGGAERVALTLAESLGADIYTTNIDRQKIGMMGFPSVRVRSIGRVPIEAPFRQTFALIRFSLFRPKERFDLIIIDGDWAISGTLRNRQCIWYCHSPMRELWDLNAFIKESYLADSPLRRLLFSIWATLMRAVVRACARRAKKIIVNSKNVQGRVERYLHLPSTVIYPPVETRGFSATDARKEEPPDGMPLPEGGYWLSVNRLLDHKRIELQFDTFRMLPDLRLVIVGSYEKSRRFVRYVERMRKIKPENVTLVREIPDAALKRYYRNAKGFLATAKDEDFGMTVVEAMAAGKPVVAVDEGGYRETMIRGRTGELAEADPAKLADAIRAVGRRLDSDKDSYRRACMAQARRFDRKVFIGKMLKAAELAARAMGAERGR